MLRSAEVSCRRLIHRVFREHDENFMTSRGQQTMLDDLVAIDELSLAISRPLPRETEGLALSVVLEFQS
jgi:hypothetical protein